MANQFVRVGRRALPLVGAPNLGGGGGLALPALVFPYSLGGQQPYIITKAGVYLVDLRGGGGSGAYAVQGQSSTFNAAGGGSAARGFRKYAFKAGDAIQLSLGAGGAAVGSNTNQVLNGNAGVASTVTFPDGSTMTMGPGGGGTGSWGNMASGAGWQPGVTVGGSAGQPSGTYDLAFPGAIGGANGGPPAAAPYGLDPAYSYSYNNRLTYYGELASAGAVCAGHPVMGTDTAYYSNGSMYNGYDPPVMPGARVMTARPGCGGGGCGRDSNMNQYSYSGAGGDGLLSLTYLG
jgi:hypothetical protein